MQNRLLPYAATAAITLVGLVLLWIAGRDLICPCGRIEIFDGWPAPGENSQHIFDWYTLSHIIHGFLFYALLVPLARWLSFGWRLALATLIEVAWEVVENSESVIEHYRSATISVDYNGDTVINSLFDVAAMWLGFALARVFPVWLSVVVVLLLELAAMLAVRDGLTLNILGFLIPMDWIAEWQAGAYSPAP